MFEYLLYRNKSFIIVCVILALVKYILIYHSRFISEGVAEESQICSGHIEQQKKLYVICQTHTSTIKNKGLRYKSRTTPHCKFIIIIFIELVKLYKQV
jgi:hypothetical protein